MSSIAQWYVDIKSVPEVNQINWLPFHYSYTSITLEGEEVAETLSKLGNVTGYLTATGKVHVFNESPIVFDGFVLSGEFFHGEKHWIVSYQSNGKWLLHTYQLKNCEDEIEQANCLAEPITQLRTAFTDESTKSNAGKKLEFYRLWEPANNALDGEAPVCRIALLTHIEF